MNRYMKSMMLAVAALIGTCGIGVSENKASATSYYNPGGHCHHGGCMKVYYVYYRSCPCSVWTYYGSTSNYYQAVNAVNSLQRAGYQTYVW